MVRCYVKLITPKSALIMPVRITHAYDFDLSGVGIA